MTKTQRRIEVLKEAIGCYQVTMREMSLSLSYADRYDFICECLTDAQEELENLRK